MPKHETTNPCLLVCWKIAFEYGSDKSTAWVITAESALGFVEGEYRVGIILKDIQTNLAQHIVEAHNARI